MGLFGNDTEKALTKIEQLIDEKNQRLTFIEENLRELVLRLSQVPGQNELEQLRNERNIAEDKLIALKEENLKLSKTLRELHRVETAVTAGSENEAPEPTQENNSDAPSARTEELLKQLESTKEALLSKEQQITDLTEKLSQAAVEVQSAKNELDKAMQEIAPGRQLLNRYFPEYLQIPTIEPFIPKWKAQFAATAPDFRVLSMCSYLFSWSNIMENARQKSEKLTSDTEKEAMEALVYFSRYFLDFLYSENVSYDDAHEISLELIERFNGILNTVGSKHTIYISYLGESYDSRVMIADSMRGSSTGIVEAIVSWGMKNPETEMTYNKCQVLLG